ncbi:MAG: hypothetical protein FJW94_10930 [Actinobacteria bacterium]|nr:hypothetical protein [Actinomycetota bacterium]
MLTILSIALVARWALARPTLRDFGRYSVATLIVIALSGPIAAVATASMWSTMGLVERIPISASSSGPPSRRSSSPGGSLSHAKRPS